MIFKIHSYIFFCQDMAKMTAFYNHVLGLKIQKNRYYLPDEWVELGGSGFRVCLHRSPSPSFEGRNKNKLVFDVEDVGEARAHLIANKVKMGKHHRWDIGEVCDGKDPEGNKFQIACKRKDV